MRAADDDDDFTLATTTRTRKKKDPDDQVKVAKRECRNECFKLLGNIDRVTQISVVGKA